jgi:hypothetical protein
MRKVPQTIYGAARRQLEAATSCGSPSPRSLAFALTRSFEALSPRIVQFVGKEGFRALLSRAVDRAANEHPWLSAVKVDAAGALIGLDEALSVTDPAEGQAGCAAMLAHLLGLLAAFIGGELTRQMVSGGWPDLPLAETDFSIEEGEA